MSSHLLDKSDNGPSAETSVDKLLRKPVLTRFEAAEIAGVSWPLIDREIRAESFPVRRISRRVVIPTASFLAWLTVGAVNTGGDAA